MFYASQMKYFNFYFLKILVVYFYIFRLVVKYKHYEILVFVILSIFLILWTLTWNV